MSQKSFDLNFSVNKEDPLVVFLEELINFQKAINVEFNNTGLLIYSMDSCNTVLLNFNYNKNEFVAYNLNGKDSIVIGLEIINIVKAVKCAKAESSINFKYSSKNPDWLYINTRTDEHMTIDHKLFLLDIESLNLTIPETSYAMVLKYNIKRLYETMNKFINKNNKYTVNTILKDTNFFLYLKDDNRNCHRLKFSNNSYDVDPQIINSDNNVNFNNNISIHI